MKLEISTRELKRTLSLVSVAVPSRSTDNSHRYVRVVPLDENVLEFTGRDNEFGIIHRLKAISVKEGRQAFLIEPERFSRWLSTVSSESVHLSVSETRVKVTDSTEDHLSFPYPAHPHYNRGDFESDTFFRVSIEDIQKIYRTCNAVLKARTNDITLDVYHWNISPAGSLIATFDFTPNCFAICEMPQIKGTAKDSLHIHRKAVDALQRALSYDDPQTVEVTYDRGTIRFDTPTWRIYCGLINGKERLLDQHLRYFKEELDGTFRVKTQEILLAFERAVIGLNHDMEAVEMHFNKDRATLYFRSDGVGSGMASFAIYGWEGPEEYSIRVRPHYVLLMLQSTTEEEIEISICRGAYLWSSLTTELNHYTLLCEKRKVQPAAMTD